MKVKLNNILKKQNNLQEEENYSDVNIEKEIYEKIEKELYEIQTENKAKRRKIKENELDSTEIKSNKFKNGFDNLIKNKNNLSKGYYLLFIAMIGLGSGSVYLASKTYQLYTQEEYGVYSSIDNSNETTEVFGDLDEGQEKIEIKEQENEVSNQDTKATVSFEQSVSVSTTNTQVDTTPKVIPLKFMKPIEGEILKLYSPDKVVYSKTLELWKTHDGIDIKGNIGDKVVSIEKGIVEKVYDDSFFGTTIVIDHGQGYKSSYSNLDKDVYVKEKQSITKGKSVGKISNTAIGEIKDEPHLHFMLFKDNKSVDPSYIFK